MSESKTKERILDTAEQLWSDHGFGTSLRAIIKEAGVNTAAIHYHFGSKQDLIEAVLLRRATPINEARLKLLDELEARHPSGVLPLEGVLDAFFRPVVITHFGPGGKGAIFPKCMGHALTAPDDSLRRILRRAFAQVFQRFTAALERALPGISIEDAIWNFHFVIGAMAFSIAIPPGVMDSKTRQMGIENPEALLERLVRFCAAGMRAGTLVKERGT